MRLLAAVKGARLVRGELREHALALLPVLRGEPNGEVQVAAVAHALDTEGLGLNSLRST